MSTSTLENQFPHRISLSQAAEISGYHQDYLGQLCRLGKIKAAKIGRNWYTTKSELETLLNFTDAIEEEAQDFNMQMPAEDEKGLFDFSENHSQVEGDEVLDNAVSVAPSVDGLRAPQRFDMTTRESLANNAESLGGSINLTESQRGVNLPAEAIVATPVVTDNYLISEVAGIPIRLQAQDAARGHHSIQTLVTRMKLDALRGEVLQLTDVMQTMAADLEAVKNLVATHDQVLRTRKDLATSYAASIDMFPDRAVHTERLTTLEQGAQTTAPKMTWQLWLAPSMAVLLVALATGWLMLQNSPAATTAVTTIRYAPPPTVAGEAGLVAGEQDELDPAASNTNNQSFEVVPVNSLSPEPSL